MTPQMSSDLRLAFSSLIKMFIQWPPYATAGMSRRA